MKKTNILLVFLALTFGCSGSFAQDAIQESMHQYILSTAIYSPPTRNNPDSLESMLTVYALIISVYVFYWFRQKI
ncbi:MAG: hypothetical protein QX198_11330 [Methylococcaceae bacterium]